MFKYIKVVFFLSFLFAVTSSYSQCKVYTFNKVDSLQKVNPKNVVVFIHTDWCKYCEKMKQITFNNDSIANLLNNNYYFISFDAEHKEPITFNNHTYSFKATGIKTGVHELALALGSKNKKISYPTTCILNQNLEIIFSYDQYLNSTQLIEILNKLK